MLSCFSTDGQYITVFCRSKSVMCRLQNKIILLFWLAYAHNLLINQSKYIRHIRYLFSLPECGEGAMYIKCYSNCLPSCYEKRPPICDVNCRVGGCACVPPFIYDEDKMKCVYETDCEFQS